MRAFLLGQKRIISTCLSGRDILPLFARIHRQVNTGPVRRLFKFDRKIKFLWKGTAFKPDISTVGHNFEPRVTRFVSVSGPENECIIRDK
jgi:hypothetical protein